MLEKPFNHPRWALKFLNKDIPAEVLLYVCYSTSLVIFVVHWLIIAEADKFVSDGGRKASNDRGAELQGARFFICHMRRDTVQSKSCNQ